MGASSTARLLAAAGLIALLSPAADSASWNKELSFSIGANHSNSRVHAFGEFYKRVKTGVEAKVNGELDRDSVSSRWSNTLKLRYSSSRSKDETDEYDDPKWVETSDKLTLDSVYRAKGSFFLQPYAALNLRTSVYDVETDSEWLAFRPVQARESAGLIWPILDSAGTELSLRAGYFNQHYYNDRLWHHDRSHGVEVVAEFDGRLAPNLEFVSKAGIYAGLVETEDSWDRLTSSHKTVLEWENTLIVSLLKYLKLEVGFHIDNKDVNATEIDYEWEQTTNLMLAWKVF